MWIGIGIACLIVVSCIEHIILAPLARRKRLIGYVSGTLGVLVVPWGIALVRGSHSLDFLMGMLTVSLSFVPAGLAIALLHYIEATNLLDNERARRRNAEKAERGLRTILDERDG